MEEDDYLTHLDRDGQATMVYFSGKAKTTR